RATALVWAEEGAAVAVADRLSEVAETAAEIEALGRRARAAVFDAVSAYPQGPSVHTRTSATPIAAVGGVQSRLRVLPSWRASWRLTIGLAGRTAERCAAGWASSFSFSSLVPSLGSPISTSSFVWCCCRKSRRPSKRP